MKTQLGLCLIAAAAPAWAGEVTGHILLDDKPAAGVTVSALAVELPAEQGRREARREPRPAPLARAVTNSKGEFRIAFETRAGQPGQLVSLACSGGGVASSWILGRFDTADSDDAGEFAARKGLPLAGRVVDAAGKPLADAQVEHPTGPDTLRTGADGTFTLEGVPEIGNDLEVRLPGFAGAKLTNLRGGRKDVVVVLKPAVSLSGIVVNADGSPVAGAVIRADSRETKGWTETDADGRFLVSAFGAGRVVVFADGGEKGVREATGIALPRPEGQPLRLVLGPPRVLTGRVVDATTRRPVAGAVVEAPGNRRAFARTGPDGSFTLRPAPPGDVRLTAIAPRYAPGVRQVAAAEAGSGRVEVCLRPAATISGRVVDEQRRPVAAVRVRTYDPEQSGFTHPPPAAVTADDGSFTLRRVAAAETVRVVARHPDFEPLVLTNTGLKPGETRTGLALTLRRGAVVTGVVTAGGEPLAGVNVFLSSGRSSYGAPPRSLSGLLVGLLRTTTGADGHFRIAGLSPGEYLMMVVRTGWASEMRDLVVGDGKGPDPLAIALVPEAVIVGRVVGKKGGGVPGQNVSAQPVDPKMRSSTSARSAADGSFRLEALKPGIAYNLSVSSIGPDAPKVMATAPAENVAIVVNGTGRLAGRVIDPDSRPVTAYQIMTQPDRSSGNRRWIEPVKQDVSSETGEFVLENVPAAPLELRVVAKGYQVGRVGGIAVEDGEAKEGIEVRLSRGAALKGRVVEARGGTPVVGAEVAAESAPSRAVADSDGGFEFEGLAPGKVRVTATSRDFTSTSETVEVTESGGTVELKMSAGASIGALVVTPGGEPVAGAEVGLAQTGQSWSNNRSVAGPDGRVRFAHLAPGRFTLTAGSGGRRSKPVDVALEADQVLDDVRIVLGGGATVLVTVTGLSPDEQRQLSVGVSGKGYVAARELPDGRFEARDVAPGRAQVYVRLGTFDASNARSVVRPVTVPDDGTVDVEVPFETGYTLTAHVVRDGQDVEGVRVMARAPASETAAFGQGTTDSSGTCRMTGLKPGAYTVTAASWTSGGAAPQQKVDLAGDLTVELVLPSGRLSGRVVSSGSQQPLANVNVSVRPSATGPTVPISHDATTDDAGRFSLSSLESGPLTLTATRKGYVSETRSVTADSPDDLMIALARGNGLDVTGRDGLLGTPLQNFHARVFDSSGAEMSSVDVPLDSSGRGEIPSLQPGAYTIVAGIWAGYAPATYEGVSVPGPALAVFLTPGGTLDVDIAAEKLKGGPLACVVTGPRGRLVFHMWGARAGDLPLNMSSLHLTNFPPVAGTIACPGLAPVSFTVTEGGSAHVTLK